jgi:hypothetical protein
MPPDWILSSRREEEIELFELQVPMMVESECAEPAVGYLVKKLIRKNKRRSDAPFESGGCVSDTIRSAAQRYLDRNTCLAARKLDKIDRAVLEDIVARKRCFDKAGKPSRF